MIRRFVHVVTENFKTGVYSLRRLDVSKHLFHQSRADAREMPFLSEAQDNTAPAAAGDEQQMLDWLQELPAPWANIGPTPTDRKVICKLPFVGLLSPRSSEDKVLCMNWMGQAILCDANKQTMDPMPPLGEEVSFYNISSSVVRPDAQEQGEEDLYVINIVPGVDKGAKPFCVRVLRSCNSNCPWESLPPPPCEPGFVDHARFIYSYTIVDGGRTICVSAVVEDIGTYCFDTVERQWRHAGHWILPFRGRAEYIPEFNLWLGFSPCSPYYNLCGMSDLKIAAGYQQPPKLQYVWQDLVVPENWFATRTQLIRLGAGRFCIAKAFQVRKHRTGNSDGFSDDDWGWDVEDQFLVLTGLEVCRGDDERLTLWKHKSVQCWYPIKGLL